MNLCLLPVGVHLLCAIPLPVLSHPLPSTPQPVTHNHPFSPQPTQASPKDSFEVAFNSACALLETGELEAAHERLQMAQGLGEETLMDEGLEEEELAKELVPITAQLAYVAQRCAWIVMGGKGGT